MSNALRLAFILAREDGRSFPNSSHVFHAETLLAGEESRERFERAYAEGYASVSSMEPKERSGTGERKFRGKV